MMHYRKFGNTDLLVSEIGFGAWAIGGGAMIGETSIGWGDVDDNVSRKAIRMAINKGINFFDTADIYGLGHSEEIIGETLKEDSKVIIATKVGNVARNDQFTTDHSMKHILIACEESLKRLRRDHIDYYQLHSARIDNLKNGECIEAMQQLQTQGKIRYWGIPLNTFDPFPEADFLLSQNSGNGFQLVLNIINQKALPLVRSAGRKGFGIVARMPLQFGLLTGKFNANSTFPVNDHRQNRLTPKVIGETTAALEPVWELCGKYNITKTQLALSYILTYPEISTIIPGIRTPEHITQNTTGLVQLDKEDVLMIERLGQTEFVVLMELIRKQG
jgi:aryl-alcohol dehydrogenase-like predicted oxidoreductase